MGVGVSHSERRNQKLATYSNQYYWTEKFSYIFDPEKFSYLWIQNVGSKKLSYNTLTLILNPKGFRIFGFSSKKVFVSLDSFGSKRFSYLSSTLLIPRHDDLSLSSHNLIDRCNDAPYS